MLARELAKSALILRIKQRTLTAGYRNVRIQCAGATHEKQ